MNWELLDTGTRQAVENMAIDDRLLTEIEGKKRGILHFYDWETPSLTYGYFTNPSDWIDEAEACRLGVSLARRPTGGGVLFHIWDFAFSLVLPKGHPALKDTALENYEWINQTVFEGIKTFLPASSTCTLIENMQSPSQDPKEKFCMAKPTVYDGIVNGRKLIGAAQRRRKGGLLHQATISLFTPDWKMAEALLSKKEGVGREIVSAMQEVTFPLFSQPIPNVKTTLKQLIQVAFEKYE